MKSIEARFNNIQSKNPLWSSLICFNEACFKGKFKKRTISQWFKLVDKKDYLPSYKQILLEQAFELSNRK